MPAQLSTLRTDVRSRLAEPVARLWSDSEINTWLNEGTRVVARRAEVIQSFNTSIALSVGVSKYALPTDVIRVHRMEFVPTGQTQTYPVKLTTYDEMDQIWGINQQIQSSYPSYAVIWGMPGTVVTSSQLNVQVFPIPAQAGTLNIFYYRLPATMSGDSDLCEVPEGWQDLVTLYATYVAKTKNHDPTWENDKEKFDEQMEYLIDMTRQWHDNQRTFITATGTYSPQWLYEFWDG